MALLLAVVLLGLELEHDDLLALNLANHTARHLHALDNGRTDADLSLIHI